MDINQEDLNGNTILMNCNNQNSELLIENGINVNKLNNFGENALIIWCKLKTPCKYLKILIKNGIDIKQKNNKIIPICFKYHAPFECIKLLIDYDCSIDKYYFYVKHNIKTHRLFKQIIYKKTKIL